jgi:DNA-binding transcriptional LysR family regulator
MQGTDRIDRRLNPRDLHIFKVVAEHGNISKAADSLAISRPVISRTIAGLEHTLGVPLFDRSPQGVEPTLYGRALCRLATTVFNDLREGMQEIRFLADPTAGELRLGCSDWAAGLVGVAVDRMSRRYPRITFDVVWGDASTLQRELKGRNIEIFVATHLDSLPKEDFDAEVLYDDPLVVVANAQHPLVRRRHVALAELVNVAWALPPVSTLSGSHVAKAFQGSGLALPTTIVNTHSHVLQHHLIATGRFVGILPRSMLHLMAKSHSLAALPVHLPTMRRMLAIVVLKKRTLSPIAQLFIETVRAVAKPLTKAKTARRQPKA